MPFEHAAHRCVGRLLARQWLQLAYYVPAPIPIVITETHSSHLVPREVHLTITHPLTTDAQGAKGHGQACLVIPQDPLPEPDCHLALDGSMELC